MPTISLERMYEMRAELDNLRESFALHFGVIDNEGEGRKWNDSYLAEAQSNASDACVLVGELSEDEDKFPTGLVTIPHYIRYETDAHYVNDQFATIIEDVDCSIIEMESSPSL